MTATRSAVADHPGDRVDVVEPQPGHGRGGAEVRPGRARSAAGSSRGPRPAARSSAWCRCRSRPGSPPAATPMITPTMVSALRSRLARSASSATRHASARLMRACARCESDTIRPSRMAICRRARAGDLAVVGDHDHRDAALRVELLEQRRAPPRPTRLSRLPVGSSASSTDGSVTSARAIATRCCSPPESWLGRWCSRCASPTRSSISAARRRRSARRTPAVDQRQRRRCPGPMVRASRWKLWKTKPIISLRSGPARRRRAPRRRGRRAAAGPMVGRSSPPSRCISVDLPEPDGPMIAT